MAADADVRQLGLALLAVYGIDPQLVQSVRVELTAYGVPVLDVRLLLTAEAFAVLRDDRQP